VKNQQISACIEEQLDIIS